MAGGCWKSVEERFWAKVDQKSGNECWEWIGARHKRGYGIFGIGKKDLRASRVAWQLANGPIPDGMGVLHRCDNPPCCNPSHLFLGDQKANHDDMAMKGRRVNHVGEAHGRAKLTNLAVAEIRKRLANGARQSDVAHDFGVSLSTVHGIKVGSTWK